jgi:hypothetical protein
VLSGLLLVSCQKGPPPPPPAGAVSPTVEGGADVAYASLGAAKAAFTRSSGSLTATLEDAQWIRLESDPASAEQRHRGYFQYGYTTFEVVTRSKQFTQPSSEEFLLEDSLGARHTGRPISYEGAFKLEDNQWWTNRFSLSFHHTVTAEVRWIRLTRVADGSRVQWDFPAAQPSSPSPPASPASARR